MVTSCFSVLTFSMFRVGYSEDIHRLVANRKLMLGGIRNPFELGEEAHSDGDVLLHAISESILGALNLGDLGTHFPDNDPKYKDIDSSLLVKEVMKLASNKGYEVSNIDIQVASASVRLAPHILKMRENVAKLLKTDLENVSIKAMSFNKVGPIGEAKAIKASSIVLMKKI